MGTRTSAWFRAMNGSGGAVRRSTGQTARAVGDGTSRSGARGESQTDQSSRTDDRDGNTEIYYAGSTFMDPYVVDSQEVTADAQCTVGTAPAAGLGDVSVVIPAGACPLDVTVTVTAMQNPPYLESGHAIGYDFGPSGLQFSEPVTITIPYLVADFGDEPPVPCWYDYEKVLTNPLSPEDQAGAAFEMGLPSEERAVDRWRGNLPSCRRSATMWASDTGSQGAMYDWG